MLYHRLIEKHLERSGTILTDGTGQYSYRQLHDQAMGYYRYFLQKGLKKGDRVLVEETTPVRTLFALLGCLAGGFIFVPLNRQTDEKTREKILQDCGPCLILNGREKTEPSEVPQAERQRISGEENACLIYTSGTEGFPKGVIATQNQILFCSEAINKRLRNGPADKILCFLPLSFDYGLYQIFLALLNETFLYLEADTALQHLPYLITRWKITALPMLPSAANLMVRAGMFRRGREFPLRYISFTGEVLPVSLICELKKLLPDTEIIPMYGLTECKRVSVMPPDREDKVLAGSCGLPLENVRVWLQDADPVTGVGELTVEGPNVMAYWNIPDSESGKFFRDLHSGQRCLHTGDLFRIDTEGFLYFVGRKNGILKIRGYRVSTAQIENRIRTVPGVREAAVTGVPDEFTGERAVVFVSINNEAARDAVRKAMKELPSYLNNSEIRFRKAELPKNRHGKIDRKFLQKAALEECR